MADRQLKQLASSFVQAQIVPDGEAGFRLVESIKMKPWSTRRQQFVTHPGHYFFAKTGNALQVIGCSTI